MIIKHTKRLFNVKMQKFCVWFGLGVGLGKGKKIVKNHKNVFLSNSLSWIITKWFIFNKTSITVNNTTRACKYSQRVYVVVFWVSF